MTYIRPTLALDNLDGMVQCQMMLMSVMQDKLGRREDLLLQKNEKRASDSQPSSVSLLPEDGCGDSSKPATRSELVILTTPIEWRFKRGNVISVSGYWQRLCGIAPISIR